MTFSNLTNKSKGDFAYTLIDVENPQTDVVLENLLKIDGVLRVRKVK